jgi:hypothetical protein
MYCRNNSRLKEQRFCLMGRPIGDALQAARARCTAIIGVEEGAHTLRSLAGASVAPPEGAALGGLAHLLTRSSTLFPVRSDSVCDEG